MSRVVLITGCSRGMGLEVAKIALHDSGSIVIGVSRSEPRENLLPVARNHQSTWIWLQADLSQEMERIRVISEIKKRDLKLTHVLHNAAKMIYKSFKEMTYEDYRQLFDMNFWSLYHLTQLLLPVLAERAHVVFISSMGGFLGSKKFHGLSLYTATKAAVANLAESLAVELRPHKVSVNAICPGAVDTDMLHQAFPGFKAPVTPAEIARFIYVFLLNAPQVMSGKVIPVALNDPKNE